MAATRRQFKATQKPNLLSTVGNDSRTQVNRKLGLRAGTAQNGYFFSMILEEIRQLCVGIEPPNSSTGTLAPPAIDPPPSQLLSDVSEQKADPHSMAVSALTGELEKPRQPPPVTAAADGFCDALSKVMISTGDGSYGHSGLSYQTHSHISVATKVVSEIGNVVELYDLDDVVQHHSPLLVDALVNSNKPDNNTSCQSPPQIGGACLRFMAIPMSGVKAPLECRTSSTIVRIDGISSPTSLDSVVEKEADMFSVVNLDWRYATHLELFVMLQSFLSKGLFGDKYGTGDDGVILGFTSDVGSAPVASTLSTLSTAAFGSNYTVTSKHRDLALNGLWDDSGGLPTMKITLTSLCESCFVLADCELIHDADHMLAVHGCGAIVIGLSRLLLDEEIFYEVTILHSRLEALLLCHFDVSELMTPLGVANFNELLDFKSYFLIGSKRIAIALVVFVRNYVSKAQGFHKWNLGATEIGNLDVLLVHLEIGDEVHVDSSGFGHLLPDLFLRGRLLSGASYGIIGAQLMIGALPYMESIQHSLHLIVCGNRRCLILELACAKLLTELIHILRPRGHFVLPQQFLEDIGMRKAMCELTKSNHWGLVMPRFDDLIHVTAVSYWNPPTTECHNARAPTEPPLSNEPAAPLCVACYMLVSSCIVRTIVCVLPVLSCHSKDTISLKGSPYKLTPSEPRVSLWFPPALHCLLVPNFKLISFIYGMPQKILNCDALQNAVCSALLCKDTDRFPTHSTIITTIVLGVISVNADRHIEAIFLLRSFSMAEVIDFLKGNYKLSCLRYLTNPLPSRDNCVGSVTHLHNYFLRVGLALKSEFSMATYCPTLGSPFAALMRNVFSLSPMAAIRLYGLSWNGICFSYVSCSVCFHEFMPAWFIEFCLVAIPSWIPQLHFSLPSRSITVLLLLLLPTFLHSQIMRKDLIMANGTILASVTVIFHSTARHSTIDEYILRLFGRAVSTWGCSKGRNEIKFMLLVPRVEHQADCLVILPLLSKPVFNMASLMTSVSPVSLVSVVLGDYANRNATVVICFATTPPFFAELMMGVSTTLVLCTLSITTEQTAQVLLFLASGTMFLMLHACINVTTTTYVFPPPTMEEEMIGADVMIKAIQATRMIVNEVSWAEFLILEHSRPEDMPYSKGGGMLGPLCYTLILYWANVLTYLSGLLFGLGRVIWLVGI